MAKAKSKSPTSRTLEELRESGYICQVVERYNSFAKVRVDLFGVIDIIALPPPSMGLNRVIGIQACAGASHAARRDKSLAESRLSDWLRCGCLFEIWSWSKQGARGQRKQWVKRVERFGANEGKISATVDIQDEKPFSKDLSGNFKKMKREVNDAFDKAGKPMEEIVLL